MKQFPAIYLSDGDGNPLRCSREIEGLACGALATVVCEDCGPMCADCHRDADNFRCSKDGQHRLTAPRFDEKRYPLASVLDAIRTRRITLQNGIQRLRAISTPDFVVQNVLAIEAGRCEWSEILPESRFAGRA